MTRETVADVGSAHRLGLELSARMHEVAQPDASSQPGLRLFGVGQAQIMRRLVDLEQRTQHCVFNMTPRLAFDPEDPAYELNERSLARGIKLHIVTNPRTVRFNPLLTSFSPWVRLAPVTFRAIVVDERVALLAGPDTPDGESTAWLATSGELLQSVMRLVEAVRAESRPALPPGTEPPLNRRQFAVARAVCLGQTDAAIAHSLGISQRTVARDVSLILQVTGAASRMEAVLAMLGRGQRSRS